MHSNNQGFSNSVKLITRRRHVITITYNVVRQVAPTTCTRRQLSSFTRPCRVGPGRRCTPRVRRPPPGGTAPSRRRDSTPPPLTSRRAPPRLRRSRRPLRRTPPAAVASRSASPISRRRRSIERRWRTTYADLRLRAALSRSSAAGRRRRAGVTVRSLYPLKAAPPPRLRRPAGPVQDRRQVVARPAGPVPTPSLPPAAAAARRVRTSSPAAPERTTLTSTRRGSL